MRVFLDSNVLFSACLVGRGRQHALFDAAQADKCRLLASPRVIEESRRNLANKVPGALAALAARCQLVAVTADPTGALIARSAALGLPAKDATILAAAVQARANLLVTGDRRHFGPLFGRTIEGVRVLSLADGLAAVLAAAERA